MCYPKNRVNFTPPLKLIPSSKWERIWNLKYKCRECTMWLKGMMLADEDMSMRYIIHVDDE